ncbi:hypothetical protein SAMN05216352_107105 [Alteribacillus bidgolensis]|uniref:Sugar phosphate isomerase/epimerase n=1 Tax=Alteribacillus bidgolensis TaxID=930129 RepID=A0A1G8K8E1_9BACI|nr:hypothetical protein [Alteribacillus bidgolensis]SDI39629.1 hypothetical protein SAMN05216352_107105 [Alteribacillus bidgolensis]
MSLVTSLDYMSFEKMINTAEAAGCEVLEFATGNWSEAPHLNVDELLNSSIQRERFLDELKKRGLKMEALNCSGNQLAPNDSGRHHQLGVEKNSVLQNFYA